MDLEIKLLGADGPLAWATLAPTSAAGSVWLEARLGQWTKEYMTTLWNAKKIVYEAALSGLAV